MVGADSVHRLSDQVRRAVALHWWGVVGSRTPARGGE
jgi:hypothetical protein